MFEGRRTKGGRSLHRGHICFRSNCIIILIKMILSIDKRRRWRDEGRIPCSAEEGKWSTYCECDKQYAKKHARSVACFWRLTCRKGPIALAVRAADKVYALKRCRNLTNDQSPAPSQKLSQSSSAPATTGWANLGDAPADLGMDGAAGADAFLGAAAAATLDSGVEAAMPGCPLKVDWVAVAPGAGRCAPFAAPPGTTGRA